MESQYRNIYLLVAAHFPLNNIYCPAQDILVNTALSWLVSSFSSLVVFSRFMFYFLDKYTKWHYKWAMSGVEAQNGTK